MYNYISYNFLLSQVSLGPNNFSHLVLHFVYKFFIGAYNKFYINYRYYVTTIIQALCSIFNLKIVKLFDYKKN